MYDSNNRQSAARPVYAYDLETWEELLFAYFPAAEVVTINGQSVTRVQKDEDMDGQAVSLHCTDKKLFTVDPWSLTKLYIQVLA